MLFETIHSHAQIQALQARSEDQACADERMHVTLVYLESVRIARDSYAILRPLMMGTRTPSWVCFGQELLEVVAGLALELHRLEHDVLPQLIMVVQDEEANLELERGVLEAALLMNNSAATLLHLSMAIKEQALELGGLELLEDDLIAAQVLNLSKVLKNTAVHVLEGNIAWLRQSPAASCPVAGSDGH